MITIWQRVISKLDVAKSNETDNKLKLMASFCRSVVCVCVGVFFLFVYFQTGQQYRTLFLRFIGQK